MLDTLTLPTVTVTDDLPPITYELAAEHRIIAEQYADPDRYELAAAMFEMIGMPTSAQRMRDRAAHYRSINT